MLITDILRACDTEAGGIPVKPERLAALVDLLGDGKINSSTAKELFAFYWKTISILPHMWLNTAWSRSTTARFGKIVREVLAADSKR